MPLHRQLLKAVAHTIGRGLRYINLGRSLNERKIGWCTSGAARLTDVTSQRLQPR